MITAHDGTPGAGDGLDRFRMKIIDAGGRVIYDNQMTDADGAAPTTALGGGNIVIHANSLCFNGRRCELLDHPSGGVCVR